MTKLNFVENTIYFFLRSNKNYTTFITFTISYFLSFEIGLNQQLVNIPVNVPIIKPTENLQSISIFKILNNSVITTVVTKKTKTPNNLAFNKQKTPFLFNHPQCELPKEYSQTSYLNHYYNKTFHYIVLLQE